MPLTAEGRWRLRTRTPVLVVTAAAWVGLVALSAGRAGMVGMTTPAAGWAMTGLMVLAMMAPFGLPVVRHVLGRSLLSRRARALTILLTAMLLTWVVGAWGLLLLVHGVSGGLSVLVAAAIVLVWQCSPAAQQCRNRHHALPAIAAFGSEADRDVLRLGVRHSAFCLAACWDLMLLASLWPGDQVPVMVLASAWVWAIALERPTRPRWRVPLPRKAGRLVGRLGQTLVPQEPPTSTSPDS